LHLTEQGARVGVESRRLKIRSRSGETQSIRLKDVCQVNLFGGVQISTQAVRRLLSEGISLGYFSSGGWFYGLCAAIGHSAVPVRRRQYARAADPAWALNLARALVRNKIRNCRTQLRRNHPNPPARPLVRLQTLADEAAQAPDLEVLLGVEGQAARIYFGEFSQLFKPKGQDSVAEFDFQGRNRRPPLDPVNAMLSLAYSILVRHFTAACALAGLDPHLGFLHADRPGRPSLALDLMEPFRPLIADSAVVTAINNGEVRARDFLTVGPSCTFTPEGRKGFIRTLERRLDQEIRHPVFGYRISYRRVIAVQTRLLARHVLGELATYPAFETR
jgi:CRISPR-associated protein Cas1